MALTSPGFFAGSIVNRLGVRTSLSLGGLGYSVYVASFLVYSKTRNSAFSVFAGALLGACAGILRSAQGCIMLAYPPEGAKGRYISCFWMIFNFGSVLGSIVCYRLAFDGFTLLTRKDPVDHQHSRHRTRYCLGCQLHRLHHTHPVWCRPRDHTCPNSEDHPARRLTRCHHAQSELEDRDSRSVGNDL